MSWIMILNEKVSSISWIKNWFSLNYLIYLHTLMKQSNRFIDKTSALINVI